MEQQGSAARLEKQPFSLEMSKVHLSLKPV